MMENFKLVNNTDTKEDNYSEWQQLENSYDVEIFDNYISIKEKFDTLFSFQDSIYYKRKYKRDFLELEFTNREILLVDQYKEANHDDFIFRIKGILYYILCCFKREHVNYSDFIRKAEKGELKHTTRTISTQTNIINSGPQILRERTCNTTHIPKFKGGYDSKIKNKDNIKITVTEATL